MRQTFKNNYSVNKSSEIILEEKEKRRGENRVENGRKEPVELMNEGERSTRQR